MNELVFGTLAKATRRMRLTIIEEIVTRETSLLFAFLAMIYIPMAKRVADDHPNVL